MFHRIRGRHPPGQVIAELAIALSILLPLALLGTQIAFLLCYQIVQTQSTGTIASVAALHGPGAELDAVVASESIRLNCEAPAVTVTSVDGVTVVGLTCQWHAPIYTDASWTVSTSASGHEPEPSPAFEPSIVP